MNKVIALLPIKAHSERVKGKNFRMMNGKPLYQWVLESLLECPSISKVIINTDSQQFIQELNKKYPAVVTINRPEEICGDMVSMNEIIKCDMENCSNDMYFLQTHTTNPLLTVESIESAIQIYFKNITRYDSLFSVNRIQARTYWKNGEGINHTLGELKRTQDLEPVYEENSNLFIFSRESFEKTNSRIGQTPYLYETNKMESLEIDEEEDFKFVELVLGAVKN